MADRSNGYEEYAEDFLRARSSAIGPNAVLRWAARLQPRASILELGCGSGVPISRALMGAGFAVYGIDASPKLIAAFRRWCPGAVLECAAVEDSDFFQRRFDAVVAWGLMFLLPPETQRVVIGKAARALERGGQLLFTAPKQICEWNDAVTGLPSVSLGKDAYVREMAAHGLALVGHDEDEGQNYYYFGSKL